MYGSCLAPLTRFYELRRYISLYLYLYCGRNVFDSQFANYDRKHLENSEIGLENCLDFCVQKSVNPVMTLCYWRVNLHLCVCVWFQPQVVSWSCVRQGVALNQWTDSIFCSYSLETDCVYSSCRWNYVTGDVDSFSVNSYVHIFSLASETGR